MNGIKWEMNFNAAGGYAIGAASAGTRWPVALLAAALFGVTLVVYDLVIVGFRAWRAGGFD